MERSRPIVGYLIGSVLIVVSGGAIGQSRNVIVAPEGRQEDLKAKSKLAMERALFANDLDSVRYWRDCWIRSTDQAHVQEKPLLDKRERTLVNFLLGAYEDVDRDIALGDHYLIGRPSHIGKYSTQLSGPYWPSGPSLTAGIKDFWRVRSESILDRIHTEVPDTIEQGFLSLYWMAMLVHVSEYTPDTVFSQAEINQRANALLPHIREENAGKVLRTYVRRQHKLARWAVGCSMTLGMNALTGSLDDQFKDARNFTFTADVEIHDWKVQFSLLDLAGTLRSDLLTDRGQWLGESPVSGTSWGGSFGRLVYRGAVLNVFPAIGIYSGQLIYREGEADEERSRPFAVPTAELFSDLKLNCLKRSNREDFSRATLEPKGMNYWMVRLRLGYAPLGYGPVIEPQGSIFFASIGIGAFTRPPRLDRD